MRSRSCGQEPPDQPTDQGSVERRSTSASSKAMLDRVFGEVLPDATRDELDDAAAGARPSPGRGESDRDDDLRRDVPPHHR